jgi:hypothetical protein
MQTNTHTKKEASGCFDFYQTENARVFGVRSLSNNSLIRLDDDFITLQNTKWRN